MESSRAELSKMEIMLDFANTGYTSQQINHINCDCLMCVNDVRPIVPPQQPRERSQNQTCILSPDAMLYLMKKCVNYKGSISIPEIIFLQEGMLFYSNDLGRLRMKDKITNIEAKKFFDDRKQKIKYSSKNLQKERQSYVLVYKTGTQQILNQAHYTKILTKRKNDPFWLQVSYSYKMPDSKQTQPPLKIYHYKRTKSVASRMISTLEKVMNEVDQQEFRQYREKEENVMNLSMLTLPENLQNSMINSTTGKGISQQFSKLGTNIPQSSLEFVGSNIFKIQKSKIRIFGSIKSMMQEIIAYLQVSFKTRVLEIEVDYTEIDGDPVILNIRKLVICDVPLQQQCYLHDRFKPIEAIGLKELVELKKMYNAKDEQTMWNVCGQILESCLQQRKIKLKLQNYKKPSKAQLKEIFIKFFPQFLPEQMFENINWKNQLSEFMSESKIKINKIIESDEGISILKRFGIVFFRTF